MHRATNRTLLIATLIATILPRCGDSGDDGVGAARDGGSVRDGGTRDAGPRDGGPRDAGERDGGPRDTGVNEDLCYPTGIYGDCRDTGCPFCLRGSTVYDTCSTNCTQTSDCGDPADFNGATPLCAAINPGAMQMICVLTCLSDEECPCGLECRPSGAGPNICATTL